MSEKQSLADSIRGQHITPASQLRDSLGKLIPRFFNSEQSDFGLVFKSMGKGVVLTLRELAYLLKLETDSEVTVVSVSDEVAGLLEQAREVDKNWKPGPQESYRKYQMGRSSIQLGLVDEWIKKKDFSRVARYFLFAAKLWEGSTEDILDATYSKDPLQFTSVQVMQDAIWCVPDDLQPLHPHPQLLYDALLTRAAVFAKAIGTKK